MKSLISVVSYTYFQIAIHTICTYTEDKKPNKKVVNAKVNRLIFQNVTRIKSPLPTELRPMTPSFCNHIIAAL